MGQSATQRFLCAAHRATGAGDYFRWETVGTALGFADGDSRRAVESLDQRKLVILLREGNARMLPAGRQLAVELEFRAAARGGGGGGGGGGGRGSRPRAPNGGR
ncbi:MAG TPA: hypothetical protein VH475_02920 [Tepidisphaeraceae bacterium]|jgi:hypothetical protein